MFRAIAASRRRLLSFGLLTVAATVAITTNSAHARRHHHRGGHHRHQVSHEPSYAPPFSSIVVDANSGTVLQANSADGLRHPASLTKIMTLYLLFERLEAGKITPNTELPVSERAAEQAPTKLGLRPGQTIEVEDAIKGLVTRSANDAAVTIAEALGGSEDEFAKLMTRKARALGMSKTVYRNASGLPDDEQVTTARDQSVLGRSIQDRFPKYYRYFATTDFHFRGSVIRNHNHLLGTVDGVDGIKTGYTRASGFNLVTSIRRGNRHLVAVVMGGRSGSSRDVIMRNLLAEHMDEGATTRTVATISEKTAPGPNSFDDRVAGLQQAPNDTDEEAEFSDENTDQRQNPDPKRPAPPAPATTATMSRPVQTASAVSQDGALAQRPSPLTNGVIASQPIATIPGSTTPLQPVKVKTVVVRAAPIKVASAGPSQIVPPAVIAAPPQQQPTERGDREVPKNNARMEQIAQPPGFGGGKGVLGVLPANQATSQAMAYADPAPRPNVPPPAAAPQPAANPVTAGAPAPQAAKPQLRAGTWIVQVGALESEAEANKRLSEARASASVVLGKADQFTEVVDKGDKRLYRARFANLDRDRAEAACRALKRSDISCIAIKN